MRTRDQIFFEALCHEGRDYCVRGQECVVCVGVIRTRFENAGRAKGGAPRKMAGAEDSKRARHSILAARSGGLGGRTLSGSYARQNHSPAEDYYYVFDLAILSSGKGLFL